MEGTFADLYKLKCQTLKSLGKCLGIPGVSKLNKSELINEIRKRMTEMTSQLNQVGGDTCIYPCPESPDGLHEFEIRGSGYDMDGNYEDLLECQHCGCKKWDSE